MRAGQIVETAWKRMRGVVGEMAGALEREKPIPRDQIEDWIKRLREAADQLEVLLKGPKK